MAKKRNNLRKDGKEHTPPKQEKKRVSSLVIILGVLGFFVLVFGGLFVWANYFSGDGEAEGDVYTLYTVRENDPVIFDGVVEPAELQQVYFDASNGEINEVFVEDGETVSEGEDLLSYEGGEDPLTGEEQDDIVVTATIDGEVILHEDALDNPEMSDSPLLEVVSEEVEVTSSVSEYDYENMETGMDVEVQLMNSDRIVDGTIASIARMPESIQVDGSSSNRFPFVVELEENIQIGFSVQVAFYDGTIYLPNSAVLTDEDEEQTYVYVYEEGQAIRRDVSLSEDGNVSLVEEGLEVDEQIIHNPDENIEDGQEIVVDQSDD